MKEQIIFKSEEGKQEILNYYHNAMSHIDYDYKEHYVDTSYGRTYIIEAGKPVSPVVFLIHGSCSNSAMWYGDMKVLAEKFHVYSVDVLGEPGNSDANRLDMNTDDHAHWINEIFEDLNIDSAVLIGNSLGGWLSLKFAVSYPDKSNKLVLIAPSGVVPTKLSFVFKSIFYAMQGEKGMKKIGKLITGMDEMPAEVLTFNKLIAKHFNPIIGAFPVFDDEHLSRLTMPVMFMAGEHDVTLDTNKAASRFEKSLPKADIQIIKDNGHVIFNAMDKIVPFLQKE